MTAVFVVVAWLASLAAVALAVCVATAADVQRVTLRAARALVAAEVARCDKLGASPGIVGHAALEALAALETVEGQRRAAELVRAEAARETLAAARRAGAA